MYDVLADPGEILRVAWDSTVGLGPPRIGPRRTTWRTEDGRWLAAARGRDGEAVRREARLLSVATPAVAKAGIHLPGAVATTAGEPYYATTEEWVWRLCTHVDGEPVDPKRNESWPAIGGFVARLGSALKSVPTEHAVRNDGVSTWADEHCRRLGEAWRPAGSDPREGTVLTRAADWLDSRVEVLTSLPRQLTHGDCHTPNLVVDPIHRSRLHGAVDLEFAAADPAVVDLASPAAKPDHRLAAQ